MRDLASFAASTQRGFEVPDKTSDRPRHAKHNLAVPPIDR